MALATLSCRPIQARLGWGLLSGSGCGETTRRRRRGIAREQRSPPRHITAGWNERGAWMQIPAPLHLRHVERLSMSHLEHINRCTGWMPRAWRADARDTRRRHRGSTAASRSVTTSIIDMDIWPSAIRRHRDVLRWTALQTRRSNCRAVRQLNLRSVSAIGTSRGSAPCG